MTIATYILAIILVWLMPLALTSIVDYFYTPVQVAKIQGERKVIHYATTVYYRYQYRTTVIRKKVCPLCHKTNSRCKAIINPISGRRIHIPRVKHGSWRAIVAGQAARAAYAS